MTPEAFRAQAFRTAFGDWPTDEPLDSSFDAGPHESADGAPEAWRIERSPPDHPGRYVARLILDGVPARAVILHDTLAGVRGVVPPGLERIPPLPGEPSYVVETWL